MTESEYRLAEKLQRFLNEEDITTLFTDVESVYILGWKNATTTQNREYYWNMVHALGDLRIAMQACTDRKAFEDHTNFNQPLDKS